VARVPIGEGELFTAENLAVKRPGAGLPPTRLWDLIGCRASAAYGADELIRGQLD
jgi:N-acetylneuraminate synthase